MLQHKNSDSEKKNLPLSLDLGPSDVLKTINTNRSESTITLFCCSHYCSTFAHNFSCNRVNGL